MSDNKLKDTANNTKKYIGGVTEVRFEGSYKSVKETSRLQPPPPAVPKPKN